MSLKYNKKQKKNKDNITNNKKNEKVKVGFQVMKCNYNHQK